MADISSRSSSLIHVWEKKPIALIHVREKNPIELIHVREKKLTALIHVREKVILNLMDVLTRLLEEEWIRGTAHMFSSSVYIRPCGQRMECQVPRPQ